MEDIIGRPGDCVQKGGYKHWRGTKRLEHVSSWKAMRHWLIEQEPIRPGKSDPEICPQLHVHLSGTGPCLFGKRLSLAHKSISAAHTGKTQPRMQNQLSHAHKRRTNSAVHTGQSQPRTQIKLTYAHRLASDMHTKQPQTRTHDLHTFRICCAQRIKQVWHP